jgi:hypothetical protein
MNNLTPEEEERLKKLLKLPPSKIDRLERIINEDEKWEWLWALTRKFGMWVFTITAALVAFRDDIVTLFSIIFGRGGPE